MPKPLDPSTILVTGGSGLLGSELKKCLPNAQFPTHTEVDITTLSPFETYVTTHGITLVIHAAAFTSPPKVDQHPERAIQTNIIGTSHVVMACARHNIKLIYISTDYVFMGNQGNYTEQDPVLPVNNYAWSKLGGECAVQLYDNALIVRTSFGPNTFPYDKAFVDQWTSRESVSIIAKKITALIDKPITGTLHIGGDRKTVMDYAQTTHPKKPILPLKRTDVSFSTPHDTSLNCEKANAL